MTREQALDGMIRETDQAKDEIQRIRLRLPALGAGMLSLMIDVHGPVGAAIWLRKRADEIETIARGNGMWDETIAANYQKIADAV